MRRTRRAGRTALAAVIALGVVAVPAAALTAPTLTGGAPAAAVASSLPVSAGKIVLSTTSSKGTVTYGGMTQEFREQSQCRIVPIGEAPDLLTIRGFLGDEPGSAGFRNGELGVYERDDEGDGASNASQCFRVDDASFEGTETLGLKLGAEVLEATLPLVASQAAVSLVRNSKSGTVSVELLDADGKVVGDDTFGWQGGKPGSGIPTGVLAVEDGVFAEVRLTATSGSFSLTDATFDLVYAGGVLDCLDEPVVLEGDEGGPAVTLRRLNNADPAEDCELIPYTLSNDDDQVQFLKPLDEQISAQFILDVVWTVSPANTDWESPDPLLPETEIDYEADNDQGTLFADPVTLRWCPDLEVDGSKNPTGITNVLDPSNLAVVDQVGEEFLEGKQFTCLVSQNARVVDGDPDYVTLAQQIYLLGDAVYRFK